MWRHGLYIFSPSTFATTIFRRRLHAAPLRSRSLIRVKGAESRDFLQGLITNDVSSLENETKSIFALLLNHQGRVLFDALLYQEEEDCNNLLLECDATVRARVIGHLKLYRLKRKIDIEPEDKWNIWVVYDPNNKQGRETTLPVPLKGPSASFPDPRLPNLGWRIISQSNSAPEIFPSDLTVSDSEDAYRTIRYKLGVGEGISEITFGNAFPLEANGDYLHGINFHKGCYLGQELTARTHHTGVVRKRLMPFLVNDQAEKYLETNVQSLQILNEKNKVVGKVRGLHDSVGIALCRIEDALSSTSLKLIDSQVTIQRPLWWPPETSEESTKA